MKAYLLLPVALLAGLVIGGIGPRSELAGLRKELELAHALSAGRSRGDADVAAVGGLLGIERRRGSGNEGTVSQPVASAASDAASAENPQNPADQAGAPQADANDANDPDASTAWDLDRAVELWQTRVGIAKSTFVSNARLNDAQALHFETTLAAMNIRIGSTIDAFAETIQQADVVQPESGIRLVNAISDAMVTAYDEMDESMPPDWRGRAGDRFTLTDFIDPEVARPLIGVEGKLQF